MKRRLLAVAIFLLLGAVVNVGVAWGSALAINPWMAAAPHDGSRTGPDGTFLAVRFRRFTVTGYMSEQSHTAAQEEYGSGPDPHTLAPAWARFGEELDSARLSEHRYIDTRGWPMRSMWSEPAGDYLLDIEGDWKEIPSEGGIETSLASWYPFQTPRIVPLRPIWLGFVGNTLFHAGLLWLLARGPFVLRRVIRSKRGQCPRCGYPVNESPVCTECGHQLSSPSVTS